MKIEFFIDYESGGDIVIKEDGQFRIINESEHEIIAYLHERIREDYPETFRATSWSWSCLSELQIKSKNCYRN